MITVNLIGKKRRKNKGRNWSLIVMFGLFGLLVACFIGSSLYILISISSLNAKITKTKREIENVSEQMMKNNESLNKYILTKFILQKISTENNGKFKYKQYLDDIVAGLPTGTVLKSVDFSIRGWVRVGLNIDDINTFKVFEASVGDPSFLSQNGLFSSLIIDNISREKSGEYTSMVLLEINTKDGKK